MWYNKCVDWKSGLDVSCFIAVTLLLDLVEIIAHKCCHKVKLFLIVVLRSVSGHVLVQLK